MCNHFNSLKTDAKAEEMFIARINDATHSLKDALEVCRNTGAIAKDDSVCFCYDLTERACELVEALPRLLKQDAPCLP